MISLMASLMEKHCQLEYHSLVAVCGKDKNDSDGKKWNAITRSNFYMHPQMINHWRVTLQKLNFFFVDKAFVLSYSLFKPHLISGDNGIARNILFLRTGNFFLSNQCIVLTKTFAVETSTFLPVSSLLRDCSKKKKKNLPSPTYAVAMSLYQIILFLTKTTFDVQHLNALRCHASVYWLNSFLPP